MTESGGAALKKAIHVARARAGITSDMQLAQRAHVSYDTLMNWYGAKTVPRGAELQKVARALGIGYSVLEAAYEGREAEPPPLQDAIRELVEVLRPLVEQATDGVEARLRAVEAELALRAGREGATSPGRSVPDGTTG